MCHCYTKVLIARRETPPHPQVGLLLAQWPTFEITIDPSAWVPEHLPSHLGLIAWVINKPLLFGATEIWGCLIQAHNLFRPDWEKSHVGSRSWDYENHRNTAVSCPMTANAKGYCGDCWWFSWDPNSSLRLEESFRAQSSKLSHMLQRLDPQLDFHSPSIPDLFHKNRT